MALLCQFTEISRPGCVNLQRFYGPVVSIYRDFVARLCQFVEILWPGCVNLQRFYIEPVVSIYKEILRPGCVNL